MKDNYQVEESDAPAVPTAMELALRKAMEAGTARPSESASARRKAAVERTEQEEILARTLRDKLRTQASGE
jgi:hypothetical protein